MYYQILSDIETVLGTKTVEKANPLNETIEAWDIPIEFKRALQWYWFNEGIKAGPELFSHDEIVLTEQKEGNLDNGLLAIGLGPNGDELMLKIPELSVWFWNHETAEENEGKAVDDCVPLFDHLLILLLHVHNKDFIPWDAFAAHDYVGVMNGK